MSGWQTGGSPFGGGSSGWSQPNNGRNVQPGWNQGQPQWGSQQQWGTQQQWGNQQPWGNHQPWGNQQPWSGHHQSGGQPGWGGQPGFGAPPPPRRRWQPVLIGAIVTVLILGVAFVALSLSNRTEVVEPDPAPTTSEPTPSEDPEPAPTPTEDPEPEPSPTEDPEPEPTQDPEPEPDPTQDPAPDPTAGDQVQPEHNGKPHNQGQAADTADHRAIPEDPAYARGILLNNRLYWLAAQDVNCSARPVSLTDPSRETQHKGLLECARQVYGPQLDEWFKPSPEPDLYYFSGSGTTPCGTLDPEGWGYFCGSWSGDTETNGIYLNEQTMLEQPPILTTHVLFHEYGHYIQWRTQNLMAQQKWPEDSTTTMKRSESQVECLGGLLAGRISTTIYSREDYDWFANWYGRMGDTPGYGTGQERWAWIWSGYNSGEATACATWSVDRI
ncbi:hypothetical protein [Enemella sp. A6]|uniref:hypothetical protein n=1 Tax=Enemella sp. A6 TaxID=3440152 RepID=UPI003EBF2861